ncbi:MAG: single-stranded DNA-binding protein [Crocinitomicaceae bacterium]|nr:single-stranded DNA-binding protein [Crocinitomicaceae bacterium]MCF8411236.1 single-stranded DNA-binding protein [Crocinitomicaceae bacterium]
MAGSVNKVILIGNLGKDPEIRRLESGVIVASFTLATSETYTDKSTGERKEITDWHDIVMWRGLAEVAEKYLKKGMKIYLEGKLKKKSWQDKEGNVRYSTEIIADEMTILSAKNENTTNFSKQDLYLSEGTPTPPAPLGNLESSPDDILPF